jgi:hypothetical protein
MISRFRTRFGTASLVVSVAALVLALAGGAFAASGGLSGKQKNEVERIAKKFAGKNGHQGPAGSSGPAGSVGQTGPIGQAGSNGKDGAAGVTGKEGPRGLEGPEGSPWIAGGTLPPGATETGMWGTAGFPGSTGRLSFPISFPIPLSVEPTEVVIVHPDEESAGGCPGRGGGTFPASGPGSPTYAPTTPEAEEGFLCIYEDQVVNVSGGEISVLNTPQYAAGETPVEAEWGVREGASTTGTIIAVTCLIEEAGEVLPCAINGTWAVTAPAE